MNIDFNNVRVSAINNFNSLVRNLNTSIGCNGEIRIFKTTIERNIDNLRSALVGIGATYEKDNEDFKCVLDDNLKLEEFAPEE